MQTITRLERQQTNTERVNVFLDGAFAFGLHELEAAQLRTGQQLSEEEIAALRSQDDIRRAIDAAVRFLSYRPRSTHEVHQKLLEKDFSEAAVQEAIGRLQRLKYLDDETFARFWIEDRMRNRPRGQQALRYELRQKGIADSLIAELLETMVDEVQGAYDAAASRMRRMAGRTPQEVKQKVGAFLQRRGFSYDAIRQALERHMQELQAEEPDFFAADPDEWS